MVEKIETDAVTETETTKPEKPDHMSDLINLAIVAAASLLSMSGVFPLLPLAVLFPVLWLKSQSRVKGWLIALIYYLVALRELPWGISSYLGQGNVRKGIIMTVLAVIILSAPYFLIWSKSKKKRMFFLPLIFLILTIPPIGIIGFANPLFAAGAIFPGAKWAGLLLMLMLIFFFALAKNRFQLIGLMALLLFVTLLFNFEDPKKIPEKIPGWTGIQTEFKFSAGKRPAKREYNRQLALIRRVAKIKQKKNSPKVIILPETAFGKWNSGTRKVWRNALTSGRLKNKIIVGGGEVWNKKKKTYENAIIQVSPKQKVLYIQKTPIPWNYQDIKTAFKKAGGNSVLKIHKKKTVPLICYESYILYPFLETMLLNPGTQTLLVMGNQWWSGGLRFSDLQVSFSKSIARLFGLPAVISVNRSQFKGWIAETKKVITKKIVQIDKKMKWYTKIIMGIMAIFLLRRLVLQLIPLMTGWVLGLIWYGTKKAGRRVFKELPKNFKEKQRGGK